MKRDDGFTLLELLVSLAILALVSAIALPSLSRQPVSKVDSAAALIKSILVKARERSIALNEDVYVELDFSRRLITGFETSAPLPTDIYIRSTSEASGADGVARIRFFPDGSSSGGSIVISHQNRTVELHINWVTSDVLLTPSSP